MRYAIRTLLGMGLFAFCWVAIAYGIFQMLQIGTCASGGPYVSARQCPPGVERIMLAIFPAVLLMLVGGFLYGTRGPAPGSGRPPRASAMLIGWSGLFLGIAFACFWGVWGPDANPGPGGDLGGLIVGFIFVPMGLGGLIALIASMRDSGPSQSIPMAQALGTDGATVVRSAPRPIQAQTMPVPGAARPPASTGGGDKIASLERLDKLRRDGAVSQAEFERLKQEIVDG